MQPQSGVLLQRREHKGSTSTVPECGRGGGPDSFASAGTPDRKPTFSPDDGTPPNPFSPATERFRKPSPTALRERAVLQTHKGLRVSGLGLSASHSSRYGHHPHGSLCGVVLLALRSPNSCRCRGVALEDIESLGRRNRGAVDKEAARMYVCRYVRLYVGR